MVPSVATLNEFEKLRTTWTRRPYVVGVALGQRVRGGQFVDEWTVQVSANRKLSGVELRDSRRSPFPQSVTLAGSTLGVDVLDVSLPEGDGQERGIVGGQTSVRQPASPIPNSGSVAAVVARSGSQGMFALTAGHVAEVNGLTARFAGLNLVGTTEDVRCLRSRDDSALIRLTAGIPGDVVRFSRASNHRIAGVRLTNQLTLAEPLVIETPLRSYGVSYRQRDARVYLPNADRYRDGLIGVSPRLTNPGDSGSLVRDANYNIVGMHIAAVGGYSYCIPIMHILQLHRIQVL